MMKISLSPGIRKEQIAKKLIVRVEMHLELQILIKSFVTSLEMNPSALHGTGLDQDSLRGKKINSIKVLYFVLQLRNLELI